MTAFSEHGQRRKLGQFSLLVLDLTTGDGLAIRGEGVYTNVRRERNQRVAGLLQDEEPFPVQGSATGTITHAIWLHGLCHPRQKIDTAQRTTSRSSFED